ncbi:dihydrofolate reductase [Mucilaginibacter corticis]|uniref:Dihydrofolate reductase n=1 Tax=Mucilaginibacter corticis TaxID=2597670 RepID=A0A556MMM0_9SPHI|nr:dihydrofolate reductase family protein [Mucilaginibacter corticis]TSJ41009.1 dihydrofolate reductase [Mucilaginibacter corticis]
MAKAEKCRIIAIEHLTLDGVFQGPATADEDTRNDFQYGGWSAAGDDPKMREAIGKYMGKGWSLLAGTRTYEDLYHAWPQRRPHDPMTRALTKPEKFVVSRKVNYPLPWEHSTLLTGEAAQTVASLKEEHDRNLLIFGSGEIVRSLMQANLLDELLLIIHPVILGAGMRLFDKGSPLARLKLNSLSKTENGVMIAAYQAKKD